MAMFKNRRLGSPVLQTTPFYYYLVLIHVSTVDFPYNWYKFSFVRLSNVSRLICTLGQKFISESFYSNNANFL